MRILAGFLLGVLLVAGALAFWAYRAVHSALPQLDGKAQVPGLSAGVRIVRDAQGVPHIVARSLADLFFAQGYVAAQDRLWQMDATRRFAAGEMAEILGPQLVQHDREQRILGLRQAAERAVHALGPLERASFEAYARGVNTFLDSHRDRLSVEFRVLRYQPRPWQASDSLLIGLYMAQLLNHGPYLDEIRREKILAKLGPELTAELYPTTSWRDRQPASAPHGQGAAPSDRVEDDDTVAPAPSISITRRSILQLSLEERLIFGSNNWVVSGAHTVTGRPLLANDMHLPHQIPNTWYEAHLEIRDPLPADKDQFQLASRYHVAGFTLPGIPCVIVGHNQRIAWGFTNLGPDVEDVYVEQFNDNGEYLTPQGWKKPHIRQETIPVRGKSAVSFGVVVTRHGPIITPLVPGEPRQLALKWGALTDPAFSGVPFLEVNAAQNWDEFRRAFSRFGGPAQNVVYADVDGHIGYQATGRIPVRASGDGSLPMPGESDAHEWIGVIPFDHLPRVFDPPSGVIATANNRITPEGYSPSLASQWFPPYRAQRIYRVLESGKKFAAADMLALQTDIYSAFDHYLAEQFATGISRSKAPSGRARAAAELLRAWDGRVTADSTAATTAVRSRVQLYRLLLEPKLGAAYKFYRWGMQSVALENILRQRPARWLPAQYSSYDELLAAAVEAALAEPETPADLSSWTWGKYLRLELQHPVFGRVPLLRRWTGAPAVEQSGNTFTVKQTGRSGGVSERMTIDLSDLDASTFNIITGQSGHILSPHYMDHFSAWHQGTSFAMAFTPRAVERARVHELVLEPGK